MTPTPDPYDADFTAGRFSRSNRESSAVTELNAELAAATDARKTAQASLEVYKGACLKAETRADQAEGALAAAMAQCAGYLDQHHRDSAELCRLCQARDDLARWKSTHAPRIEALQGLKDHAQADAEKGAEAIASLASEREANAILTAEVEALRAEVDRLRPKWLPIEMAPKNGAEIILRRGSRVGAGIWVHWPATEEEEYGQGWTIGFDGNSWDGEKEPSHWMPLPPPPVAEGV